MYHMAWLHFDLLQALFKGRTFELWVFNTGDLNVCVHSTLQQ